VAKIALGGIAPLAPLSRGGANAPVLPGNQLKIELPHNTIRYPLYSGITDGGKCPPGSSDVGPFSEMSPLNSASFTT